MPPARETGGTDQLEILIGNCFSTYYIRTASQEYMRNQTILEAVPILTIAIQCVLSEYE